MKIRRFLLSHRKILIVFTVMLLLITLSVYQSIYADDDGIPTSTVYWMVEPPFLLDKASTWILPHNGGYLCVTNDGTVACELNAGMSLSFCYTADEPLVKFHALYAKDDTYQILCSAEHDTGYTYSLQTVSADGSLLNALSLYDGGTTVLDCRMNNDCLALLTETQFLVFSITDSVRLLYEQEYTGASPQVCMTDDTVLFSVSAQNESTLYEFEIKTDTVRTAEIPMTPLFALSAAPDKIDSKYLIGCGKDLLGLDEQFTVKERILDLRVTWQRSTTDSTVIQTLSQDNIAAVHPVGTVLYITDTDGRITKLDIFWGNEMQTLLS